MVAEAVRGLNATTSRQQLFDDRVPDCLPHPQESKTLCALGRIHFTLSWAAAEQSDCVRGGLSWPGNDPYLGRNCQFPSLLQSENTARRCVLWVVCFNRLFESAEPPRRSVNRKRNKKQCFSATLCGVLTTPVGRQKI